MKLTTKLLTVMAIALDEALEKEMSRTPEAPCPEGTRIHEKPAKEVYLIESAIEWVDQQLIARAEAKGRKREKVRDTHPLQ